MSEYYFDQAVTLSKAVANKCTELKDILKDLGKAFQHISQVNKMAKLGEAEDLFMSLSKIMTGTGENICTTGDLINQYCGSHLKYHILEVESLREVYKTRDHLYS